LLSDGCDTTGNGTCTCGGVPGCDPTTADHCDATQSPTCRCGTAAACTGGQQCLPDPITGAATCQ
jgi:hypothetical protein